MFKNISSLRNILFLLPVVIAGYILLSAQNFQSINNTVNTDPRMTRIYTSGEYSALPMSDNVVFSNAPRFVSTPNGTYSISPNYRVHPSFGTQSETPIVRHPTNPLIMLASANTFRGGSSFSSGVYVTTNGGVSWFGSDTLNNGSFNYGDPGPVIDKDGRFIMSYITLTGAVAASYSTDNGITWAPSVSFPGSTTSGDKNFSGTKEKQG